MADNTTLNHGSGGDTIATDDRGGVKFQKVLVNAFDGPSCDAFGRWRVSNPKTVFDSKLLRADKAPLFWDESAAAGTSSSTPTAAKPYIDITSTDSTADTFVRQTFRRFGYQPGKSQLILMTGVLDLSGGGTGVQRRIGYFDDNNGVFFEDDAGTIGITTRSSDSGSPVDTTVTQANWNMDTMDGGDDANNPSGITFDGTKAQLFVIDFQWFSIGRVRFGLQIGGVIEYVHQVLTGNVNTIPWTSTPNLPLRYEMITTGSSPASKMRCICSCVISEGGVDDRGVVRYTSTAGTHVDCATENVLYAIVGLQLKSSALGATIDIAGVSIGEHVGDKKFEWVLLFNPTVAGTFTYGAETNSSVNSATGASTNTVTGGTAIAGGFSSTGKKGGAETFDVNNELKLGSQIDGTADEIVLCIRPVGGSSAIDIEGGLTWRETL